VAGDRTAVHKAELPLRPWEGVLRPDPLRHPWAEVGGPADDLAWVANQVEVTGPPRQHRTWNLSAIWSIPTATGTVWLKCVPPFFAHEIAVLDTLRDLPVPQLIAADDNIEASEQIYHRDDVPQILNDVTALMAAES